MGFLLKGTVRTGELTGALGPVDSVGAGVWGRKSTVGKGDFLKRWVKRRRIHQNTQRRMRRRHSLGRSRGVRKFNLIFQAWKQSYFFYLNPGWRSLFKFCIYFFIFIFIFIYLFFQWPHLQHMEVPRFWVKSELQLPAYTTAIATRDPSCICDLHHSLQQCWILNSLSEDRDRNPHPHGY